MTINEMNVRNDITLRITSTLDIPSALLETKEYLSHLMPIDELIMFKVEDKSATLQFIIRINNKGIVGEEDLSQFYLHHQERTVKNQLFEHEDSVAICTRTWLEKNAPELNFETPILDLGLPRRSDIILLFDKELESGLMAVSYDEASYNSSHVELFEHLKEPFQIAVTNAIRYNEIQHKSAALADDNLLFREATIRLTSETDIAKAFQNTVMYLKKQIALQQIVLLSIDDSATEQRVMLRVDAQNTIEETNEYLRLNTNPEEMAHRQQLLEHLPDVFVKSAHDTALRANSGDVLEQPSQLLKWGIDPSHKIVVLGVKVIRSALLFVFEPTENIDKCMHLIETLKEPFVISLHNAMRFFELEEHKNRLAEENHELLNDMQRDVGDRVIGMHDGLKHVMSLATQVAGKPSPVLLMGETGTGKEVVATAIHRISERSTGPFISLNCGAIPEQLVDSELFGHEKGAFTGANSRKRGRFERADGGTLFLDEIGELPPSAQVKLLRVLQEKEFERVGGSHPIRSDVRLIAATNRDLPSMIRNGQFREDLWFRLNVFPIEIPPLRKRPQDIPALTYFFIETKMRQLNLPFRPSLPAEEMHKLTQYNWPGNVRELQNTIERALILCHGEPLAFPFVGLQTSLASATTTPNHATVLENTERTYADAIKTYFTDLLSNTRGKIAGPGGAAQISGLNPSTLRSKLKKWGIDPKAI